MQYQQNSTGYKSFNKNNINDESFINFSDPEEIDTQDSDENHLSDSCSDSKPFKKTRRDRKRVKAQRDKKLLNEQTINDAAKESQVVQKEPAKYKTELCKNWIETGKCKYSVRCRFAHGK